MERFDCVLLCFYLQVENSELTAEDLSRLRCASKGREGRVVSGLILVDQLLFENPRSKKTSLLPTMQLHIWMKIILTKFAVTEGDNDFVDLELLRVNIESFLQRMTKQMMHVSLQHSATSTIRRRPLWIMQSFLFFLVKKEKMVCDSRAAFVLTFFEMTCLKRT